MDPNELFEKLKKSLRTGNLIVIEGLIIVLLAIILFTAVDFGSLFQGFSGVDLGDQEVKIEGSQTGEALEYESKLKVDYLTGQTSSSTLKSRNLDFRYPYAAAEFSLNNTANTPQIKIKEVRIITRENKQVFKFTAGSQTQKITFSSEDLKQVGSTQPIPGINTYEADLYYEGSAVKTISNEFEIYMPGVPTINSTTPANNSTSVPTTANSIDIFFNEAGLSLGANASATLTKKDSSTNLLSNSALIYNTTKKALVISHNALEKGETYIIRVSKESVLNLSQALPADFSLTFTTSGTKSVTPPPKGSTPTQDTKVIPPTTAQSPQISKSSVLPKDFNPLIKATKISYTLTKKAKVEIRIVDKNGNTVVKLLDNKEKEATSHDVWWNGTDKTTSVGEVVPAGEYSYRIVVRDPATNAITDSKTGKVKATYAGATPKATTKKTTTATTAKKTTDPLQAKAIQALQNTKTGKTAETGPSMLIYTLFPLTAYLIRRKK